MNDLSDDALHDALLLAHERHEGAVLVGLYADAAQRAQVRDQTKAQAFFLTQAYVFALEIGLSETRDLREQLIELGAET